MANAPVYYALAQAQFNPVAAMAKYVDEIQDIFRHQGFTLFDTQHISELQFVGQNASNPELRQVTNWVITKADRTAGFILGSSSMIYHTTHYDTRNDFLPELIQGLNAVHEVVTLDHIARLGLRYLDAVLPSKGETVSQYLVEGLNGISFGAKQRYAMSESVFDTETAPLVQSGTLVSRVYRGEGSLGFPPDLIPYGLQTMSRFQIAEEVSHAIIDTDHFVEGTMPVDFDRIKEQLASLHAIIKQSFEATITPFAKEAWR
jgi:uncharacterized protein (TIGR04255 family)